MLDSIRPTFALVPLRMPPAKVRSSLPLARRTIEVLEARPLPRATDEHGVILHNDIPPELLTIPQVPLGKSAAMASYTSNRPNWTPPVKPPENGQDLGRSTAIEDHTAGALLIEHAETADPHPLPTVVDPRERSGPAGAVPFVTATPVKVASKDGGTSSFDDEEWPLYLPEPVSAEDENAEPSQPSKLRSFFQGVLEYANDAYCEFLSVVPYTAGICMNLLA